MLQFHSVPRPATTIWGPVQEASQPVPGIWWVSTASHGGFILSDERQDAMPPILRLDTPSYEEDCNYALVVLAFEQEFNAAPAPFCNWADHAHKSAINWNPLRYATFTGQTLSTAESHVLTSIDAWTKRIGKICVTAAFGCHQPWVPQGSIGIIGRTVVSVDDKGFARFAHQEHFGLCDNAHYDAARGPQSFDELAATIIANPNTHLA